MRVVIDLLDERTRIFGLFHSWMWQSRYSEVDVNLVERWGQTGWLSNHNSSLRSCSHERNLYRFLSTRTGRVFCHDRVSPFCHDLDLGLVGLVGCLLVVEQLLNPFLSSNHVSKKSLEAVEVMHVQWFEYNFSNFHPNNFRDAISWECIVKNGGVRSRLIELQSFLVNKFAVDPIHRVLMFLSCFTHLLCKTRCSQVDRIRILVFFILGIHKQKEYCLSVAQILTSWYQSWIDDGK